MELVFAYEYERSLRRERVFKDPMDLLNLGDDELLKKYRFPRHVIVQMIEEFGPQIKRNTSKSQALPASTQILAALSFYASGSLQSSVCDTFGLSQVSLCNVIISLTNILSDKARMEIKMPSSMKERQQTMQDFHSLADFPRVIGAIDGCHIPIKAPTEDEETFINKNKFHSLNIQLVADANRRILSYNVNYPGSTRDAFIWSNSNLRTRFQNGEFRDAILLGDADYPLEPCLMTPFVTPVTPAERRYNQSHERTRGAVIKQTFGTLKSRFRCLHKSGGGLQYDPVRCAKIVLACLLLHNRCIEKGIPHPQEDLAHEDAMPPDPYYDIGDPERGRGRQVRNALVENFFSDDL